MSPWLDLLRGPVFRFAIIFFLLNIIRGIFLFVVDVSNKRRAPWWRETLVLWLDWFFAVSTFKQSIWRGGSAVVFHLLATAALLLLGKQLYLWPQFSGRALIPFPDPHLKLWALGTLAICLLIFVTRISTLSSARDAHSFFSPLLLIGLILPQYIAYLPMPNVLAYEGVLFAQLLLLESSLIAASFFFFPKVQA